MNNKILSIYEARITLSVCIIIILRMLGMFMIVPAMHTTGILFHQSNTTLIGLAVGIYGLMQSIAQIPFGFLSNKIGYQYTIFIGLFLFFLGSLVLCVSNSIFSIILGRGLQGLGTVSSIFIILLSNVIREQNYTKSIACVGVSFGLSFLVSIIFGPIVITYIGLYGLFKVILLLSILCMYITKIYIFPYCNKICFQERIKIYQSSYFIKKYDIFGYIISIFFLHFILTLNFIIFPKTMELLGYTLKSHVKIYFLIIIFSLLIIIPLMIFFEYKKYIRFLTIFFIFMIIISSSILLIFKNNFLVFFISMYLFFISFVVLESFLPSLLSRILPPNRKNIIMSIYATSQFFGTALGGILGGFIYQYFGITVLLMLSWIISIMWCVVFYFISSPPYILHISFVFSKEHIINFDFCNFIKYNYGVISIDYIRLENSLSIKFDAQKSNIHQIKNFFKKL